MGKLAKFRLALLLGAMPVAVVAAPVPKEQLLVAPADARHFTISSNAGKHGDIWAWTMPDGRSAYRMSMSLRGWITETDETILNGPDGTPTEIVIRGFTDSGDAGETYSVDSAGMGRWKTSVDAGSAAVAGKRYSTYGGPWLAGEQDIAALLAAGDKGIELLPSGRGSITLAEKVEVAGPSGPRTLQLAFMKGSGFAPYPLWVDADRKFFGFAGGMGLLPAGYEGVREQLKTVQEAATATLARDVSRGFLAPANATPTLIDNVKIFDAVAGRYQGNRAVLVANGKIIAVGAAGSVKAPAGATTLDGRGKTLVPGLWDSHLHVGGDDWNLIQNVATGILNYRSPGSLIEDAQSIARRRAAGDLLAPDGKVSIIIDRKDPLAAQGSLTVSSLEETLAAVRKIKAAGMWGVKFYTS
ncbi:MAG: amidohydrolase, partial [Sphingomicrobium sp.]